MTRLGLTSKRTWTPEDRRRTSLKLRHQLRVHRLQRTCKQIRWRPSTRRIPPTVQRAIMANAALAHRTQTEGGTHQPARFDTDSETIGIDNRCSACISDKQYHFEDLRPSGHIIRGFGNSKTVDVMTGTLRWKWLDDDGREHTIRIPNSFYVPSGKMRLMSPQHVAQALSQQGRGTLTETTDGAQCVLTWGTRSQYRKTIPIDNKTNVFTFHLAPGFTNFFAYCAQCNLQHEDDLEDPLALDATMVSDDEYDQDELQSPTYHREGEADDSSDNEESPEHPIRTTPLTFDLDMNESQGQQPVLIEDDEEDTQPKNHAAEFLKYHHKYNHCSPTKIQAMARKGELPSYLAKCDVPVCSACQFGKATRRPWRNKNKKNSKKTRSVTRPGQVVSVDMMEAGVPGLIAQAAGFLTKKRYTVATVYVDQYSNFSYVHYQKSTSVEETVEGKEAFERLAASYGVAVQHYHADNGTFAAKGWIDACHLKKQTISFAGVYAHHQNGKAEVRIKHLQDLARTSLIHAAKRWPEAINAHLWPYAFRMANLSINATPWLGDPKKRSPQEMFSGSQVDNNPKHWHHFGCPVFVLDKEVQKGRRPKGGKWMERSQIGIYLGPSPHHARSVALVLNAETGRVGPEFHVRMDSKFHSVKNSTRQERPKIQWMRMAYFLKEQGAKKKSSNDKSQREQSQTRNPLVHMHDDLPVREDQDIPVPEGDSMPNQGRRATRSQGTNEPEPIPTGPTVQPDEEPPAASPEQQPQGTRRSTRTRKGPQRLIEAMHAEMAELDVPFEVFAMEAMFPHSMEQEDVLAMKASSDPDTMYMHEAMRQPDKKEFQKAMTKEMRDQIDQGVIELVQKSDLPKGATLLPAVWQMKRKRDIKTREVKKHKARLNIDGSRMVKHRDYDLTYAPVASWGIIKLLLALVLTLGWHTVQLDYVLAFTQAPVERELYMRIPKGMEVEGGNSADYCFKLKKNTYGQKQAGRVWNQFLVKKLRECGFVQSKIDDCVFYNGKMIYVLYTDDSIIAGPDKSEINKVIEKMQKKLELTVEGDLEDFLGVNIEKKDGGYWLTQPQLINQILEALRFKQKDQPINQSTANPKSTPMVSSRILQKEPDSPDFDNQFNYRSVIGKIAYLEKGTRPELAYACHQCSRFSSDPKKAHGEAVKRIGRYLLGTADKGMFVKPDISRSFEVFVDADFCGNWDKRYGHEPDTARSRHGYVITYAGIPIVHKSQLQTEIALSSTESEYTGLSYALREAIPLMRLLKEMKEHGIPVLDHHPKVHCRVFEDNSGALEIASVHKWRPRTKHICVKLHHFRSYVTRKLVSIHKIATEDQPADIFTKPLAEELFVRHRKWLLGW